MSSEEGRVDRLAVSGGGGRAMLCGLVFIDEAQQHAKALVPPEHTHGLSGGAWAVSVNEAMNETMHSRWVDGEEAFADLDKVSEEHPFGQNYAASGAAAAMHCFDLYTELHGELGMHWSAPHAFVLDMWTWEVIRSWREYVQSVVNTPILKIAGHQHFANSRKAVVFIGGSRATGSAIPTRTRQKIILTATGEEVRVWQPGQAESIMTDIHHLGWYDGYGDEARDWWRGRRRSQSDTAATRAQPLDFTRMGQLVLTATAFSAGRLFGAPVCVVEDAPGKPRKTHRYHLWDLGIDANLPLHPSDLGTPGVTTMVNASDDSKAGLYASLTACLKYWQSTWGYQPIELLYTQGTPAPLTWFGQRLDLTTLNDVRLSSGDFLSKYVRVFYFKKPERKPGFLERLRARFKLTKKTWDEARNDGDDIANRRIIVVVEFSRFRRRVGTEQPVLDGAALAETFTVHVPVDERLTNLKTIKGFGPSTFDHDDFQEIQRGVRAFYRMVIRELVPMSAPVRRLARAVTPAE